MTKPIISFRNLAKERKHRKTCTDIVFEGDKNISICTNFDVHTCGLRRTTRSNLPSE